MSTPANNVVRLGHLRTLKASLNNLAIDIVLSTSGSGVSISPEAICEAYKMTPAEMVHILSLPEFKTQLETVRTQITGLGKSAPMILTSQIMAQDINEQLYREASSSAVQFKDKLALAKHLANIGMLDPSTNGTNRVKESSGGGNMAAVKVINMTIPPGISGLEHIYEAVLSQPAIENAVEEA